VRRSWILLVVIALLLASCGAQPSPEPTTERPTESLPAPTTEQPTDTPLPPTPVEATEVPPSPTEPPTEAAPAEYPGLPLPDDRGTLFSASGACAICHTQMVDGSGADVSIDTFWRASMMANSARDPYWLASVRGEALSHPEYRAVIEDKCAACHMPMAHSTAAAEGGSGVVLDDGFSDPAHPLHALAIDGISCTVCHQIRQDGFGEEASFSGGYVIDTEKAAGEREAFGQFQAGRQLVQIMQSASGFVPVQSPHLEQAQMCATCHMLYTPYVDAAGEIAGLFPEQMAYQEWQASSFGGSVSCLGCHMPVAQGGVQLSTTGGPPRSPFYQHKSVGGNAYMADILRTFGEELEVTASSAQFQHERELVEAQLQQRTASLVLKQFTVDGSTLTVDVAVAIMTGHKFPTGFPARRAWIHLTVQDAGGQVIFESGAVGPDGSIVGNDNDADEAAYEAHYLAIDSPDQVQIYESIMGDSEGKVTTTLLKGATYLKDNRLLPAGFDKGAASADIAVHGAALEDPDFAGGTDEIQYVVAQVDDEGPFVVTAELLYQSIGFRWADNLRRYEAPEPERFIRYYEQVPNQPVVVSTVTKEVNR
jgi:hypothetical protein